MKLNKSRNLLNQIELNRFNPNWTKMNQIKPNFNYFEPKNETKSFEPNKNESKRIEPSLFEINWTKSPETELNWKVQNWKEKFKTELKPLKPSSTDRFNTLKPKEIPTHIHVVLVYF